MLDGLIEEIRLEPRATHRRFIEQSLDILAGKAPVAPRCSKSTDLAFIAPLAYSSGVYTKQLARLTEG